MALTGWRRGEALHLRWDEVDLDRRTARLRDTKTGASIRPLSEVACDVLRSMPRNGSLVFPGTRVLTVPSDSGAGVGVQAPMGGFRKFWLAIAAKGPVAVDVSPHVLRHSFASLAADLGLSEPTIAALIGHKGQSITSRYMHAADAVLLAAADTVANRTAELMVVVDDESPS